MSSVVERGDKYKKNPISPVRMGHVAPTSGFHLCLINIRRRKLRKVDRKTLVNKGVIKSINFDKETIDTVRETCHAEDNVMPKVIDNTMVKDEMDELTHLFSKMSIH